MSLRPEESGGALRRPDRTDWTFATVLNVVTLMSIGIGGVAISVEKSRDIAELQAWRADHEALHKAERSDVTMSAAKTEERLHALEADMHKLDNLTFRLSATEQSTSLTAAAIRELQTLIGQQAGNLKVVREILQRLEAAQQRRAP